MAEDGSREGPLRWLFAGQGDMGAAALEALLDAPAPVAVLAAEPPYGERPLAAAAEARGLELLHVDRLGADPARQWPHLFEGLDVAVACCWAERLRPAALSAPERGWLNLHPSALPAWRGADPIAWQLLTSPSRIGCSVHRMTERHDDGPVVASGSVAVGADDDRGALLRRSGAELGRLTAAVLASLQRGEEVPERPQAPDEATWCPPAAAVPLIDPRAMTAAAGARVARAFSPRPGVPVATLPPGQRFAFLSLGAELRDDDEAGTVTREADGEAEIAFRDRWLRGRLWTLATDEARTGEALSQAPVSPQAEPLPIAPRNHHQPE